MVSSTRAVEGFPLREIFQRNKNQTERNNPISLVKLSWSSSSFWLLVVVRMSITSTDRCWYFSLKTCCLALLRTSRVFGVKRVWSIWARAPGCLAVWRLWEKLLQIESHRIIKAILRFLVFLTAFRLNENFLKKVGFYAIWHHYKSFTSEWNDRKIDFIIKNTVCSWFRFHVNLITRKGFGWK